MTDLSPIQAALLSKNLEFLLSETQKEINAVEKIKALLG